MVGEFAKHVLATLRRIGHERRDAKCELSLIAGVLLLKSLRFQHALLRIGEPPQDSPSCTRN